MSRTSPALDPRLVSLTEAANPTGLRVQRVNLGFLISSPDQASNLGVVDGLEVGSDPVQVRAVEGLELIEYPMLADRAWQATRQIARVAELSARHYLASCRAQARGGAQQHREFVA